MPTLPKLAWQTVNVETMPKEVAKLYAAYRQTLEATTAARIKFEDAASAALVKAKAVPAGQEPRFGYNWGKLAIAFAEPSKAKTAGANDMFTF